MAVVTSTALLYDTGAYTYPTSSTSISLLENLSLITGTVPTGSIMTHDYSNNANLTSSSTVLANTSASTPQASSNGGGIVRSNPKLSILAGMLLVVPMALALV